MRYINRLLTYLLTYLLTAQLRYRQTDGKAISIAGHLRRNARYNRYGIGAVTGRLAANGLGIQAGLVHCRKLFG